MRAQKYDNPFDSLLTVVKGKKISSNNIDIPANFAQVANKNSNLLQFHRQINLPHQGIG